MAPDAGTAAPGPQVSALVESEYRARWPERRHEGKQRDERFRNRGSARRCAVSESTVMAPPLQISIGRHVSAAAAEYARVEIGPALLHAPEPVIGARVRVTGHADPTVSRPIVAQADVDVNGRGARVQVAAATTAEAVDLLADRLETRLDRLGRHRDAARHGRSRAHDRRHGDGAAVDQGGVVRADNGEQDEVTPHGIRSGAGPDRGEWSRS